jgi:hypothetical protein
MKPGTISGPYIHTAGSCAAWTKMRCGETYTATSIDAGQNQHRRTKRNLTVTFFLSNTQESYYEGNLVVAFRTYSTYAPPASLHQTTLCQNIASLVH